eukprot:UN12615
MKMLMSNDFSNVFNMFNDSLQIVSQTLIYTFF